MEHHPISALEFWWCHLSFDQQVFITDWFKKERPNVSHDQLVGMSYSMVSQWHNMPGWPECKLMEV